mgnify:CR=1 FL=1
MKIKNITEPSKFFTVLEECKGTIELITLEGDRLNLKSKLCQYVALSKIFKDANIKDIEIIFSEPEDVNRVLKYLIRG